jgi:hypothetical protein
LYNVTANTPITGASLSGNTFSISGLATIAGTYSAAVNQPPIIITQPQSTTTNLCAYTGVTFNVSAGGYGTLLYQWQDSTAAGWTNITNGTNANGSVYGGTTTASFTVTNFPYSLN